MKILCDVHISIKIAKLFASKGIASVHVNDILDKWFTSDIKISDFADENDFTVITKDSDFKNSHFIKRSPKKLIKINLGNISTIRLLEIFESCYTLINEKFDNNLECYFEINSDYFLIINENENIRLT
jgi:predicted nuclease of predicted toxin-antitoxin system